MSGYRLTDSAGADLAAIFWQSLEQFGPSQTERYLGELENLFSDLALFPNAARLRSDLTPPVRVRRHKAHVIVYNVEPDGVAILRIRHVHEDWLSDAVGQPPSEDQETT